ncbi:biotin--protein ligase [Ceratina calcarata]|uniref:Biotin--protein ligase n=1 Tax=Ceratina calcarata TaxID=156304 RepID=A0AAJ7S8I0_9HYME|nr:biotin--protein ligase [Ceratina calcarata]
MIYGFYYRRFPDNKSRSEVSTPISAKAQLEYQSLSDEAVEDTIEYKGVPHSGSKSLDTLDNLDDLADTIKTKQASCSDIKEKNKPFDEKAFYDTKRTQKAASTSAIKSSMTEITKKLSTKNVKPPNILIYADSLIARNNVKTALKKFLGTERYTIYALSSSEARNDAWIENAVLVVVCGNVGSEIGNRIVEYILRGGKLLALCSDIIHILLPLFKTAEVRENELVHFSYGKWKNVRMMHHIFCYQASPVRTKFSQDQKDPSTPSSISIKDKKGNTHVFELKVLGTEETWHTPSILLATLPSSGGKVVFSQIHLEVDPMEYELEESKFAALKESNETRLEIFNDLLKVHLGIEISNGTKTSGAVNYTPAFFLGRHESKLEMLEKLKDIMQNDTLKTSKLEIQFCRSATSRSASSTFLPIMMHQCPENFSTVEYFDSLKTSELGRLVIYADVMTSSMDVFNGHKLRHGLAVIVRQQTNGKGRGTNVWLNPEGSATFTLQLHIKMNTIVGQRISILQHLISVAIISAFKSQPGYEELDLRLKWPNDIYVGNIKIGGMLITTQVLSNLLVCNVGIGFNLFNTEPTICIKDIINEFNRTFGKNVKMISYEQYFAIVFNEIERWLDVMQSGDVDLFLDAYYEYWMHSDTEVTVLSASGTSQNVKILGIDEFGYLRVRGEDGTLFSVHPDGNTFDCLKGLIAPK